MAALPASFDYAAFGRAFLADYLENGFGVLPKRELDHLVIELVSKAYLKPNGEPELMALSRLFRVSPRKIRLALDTLAFREDESEDVLRSRLRDVLKTAEIAADDDRRVNVQIEEARLREFAIAEVRRHYGIVDWGLNREVLRLTEEKFLLLAVMTLSDEDREQVKAEVAAALDGPEGKEAAGDKRLWRAFLENYVESAGKKAGEVSVDMIFGVLTGGVGPAINLVRSIFAR